MALTDKHPTQYNLPALRLTPEEEAQMQALRTQNTNRRHVALRAPSPIDMSDKIKPSAPSPIDMSNRAEPYPIFIGGLHIYPETEIIESEQPGMITNIEQAVDKAIDVAEAIEEGVSKYHVAKVVTKGLASVARKMRDKD